jgi:hypothetical protein
MNRHFRSDVMNGKQALDAIIAGLDGVPAHTPLPEPPARWAIQETLPGGSIRWQVVEHELHARGVAARLNASVGPLYSEAQMRALADRLAEAESERDEMHKQNLGLCRQVAGQSEIRAHINMLEARATTAEARLKQAVDVMRPFAETAEHDIGDDETDGEKFTPMQGRLNRAPLITVGHMRAARNITKENDNADR